MLSTLRWNVGRAGRRLARARQGSGVLGLAGEGARITRDLARKAPPLAAGYLFDVRRGIRTRGLSFNEERLAGVSVGGDPHYYEPVTPTRLRWVFEILPLDRASTTFVDLGAGRGRAVIMAAEMGFGRALGVELDQELVVQAEENLRRWRAKGRTAQPSGQEVAVVHGDAATWPLPDGPLVLSLFNPFGPATLRLLLENLGRARESSPDPVYLVFVNPEFDRTLAEFPWMVPHVRHRHWSVYRLDGVPAADRYAAEPSRAV